MEIFKISLHSLIVDDVMNVNVARIRLINAIHRLLFAVGGSKESATTVYRSIVAQFIMDSN